MSPQDEVLLSLGVQPPRRRKPQPECGTHSAYVVHAQRGEEPCAPCRQANADYKRERRAARKDPAAMPPINHGTHNGARQHWYRQENPCAACRAAYNVVHAEAKRARKAKIKAEAEKASVR